MKTLISTTRVLAVTVAMFSFASGAWAEHDGDGIVHDEEVVTDTEVVGEEVVGEEAQSGVAGEEVIFYMMDGEGAVDGTQYVDAEGNVIYVGNEDGAEMEYIPLMATSGAAGGAVTLADTAADQAGVDSTADMSLDVVGSTQADFASPIDVATVMADGSARSGKGGVATRISGGHLDSHQ